MKHSLHFPTLQTYNLTCSIFIKFLLGGNCRHFTVLKCADVTVNMCKYFAQRLTLDLWTNNWPERTHQSGDQPIRTFLSKAWRKFYLGSILIGCISSSLGHFSDWRARVVWICFSFSCWSHLDSRMASEASDCRKRASSIGWIIY